jgi:hypothetical protein
MHTENAMKQPALTRRRLGRADFLHLAAWPVRLTVDRGTVWVTQDGEPEDIQLDAGGRRDFDGHTRLMVGTLGGEATLQVAPLPRPHAAAGLPWLHRWLGSLWNSGAHA